MSGLGPILQSLEFAESLLGTSSRDAGDGLLAFDLDCLIIYWSAQMARISDIEPDRALGRSAFELLPYLIEIGEDLQFRAALAGQRAVSLNRSFAIPRTNRRGLFDAHYAPLLAADGVIVGGVAVIRDVTAAREAEERLAETEKRFQLMADVAPVLLWMSRTDSMCTFFNQSWLNFTGRTLEQEWGVGWAEGVHFEDLQRCLDGYLDAFNARRVFEVEYRLRRADGEYRWILDQGTPRYTPDGTFAGYIGSCIDITDRKQMEADLRQALRSKDDFLGMVSHELRTPVTALQLLLERLHREGTDAFTTRQQDVVRRMGTSVERLSGLIESVLEFSRIEGGRLRLDKREFDLVQLAKAALEEARPSAERKGLELRFHAGDRLPPTVSDPDLVQLILSNLLANAIKFTDRGSVEVAVSAHHNAHRLVVKDTGRGIPPEEHARIFEPFEQLEATRQKHTPGVGLGLALVKAITAALGGHIRLESQRGQGSAFVVDIPQAEPSGRRES